MHMILAAVQCSVDMVNVSILVVINIVGILVINIILIIINNIFAIILKQKRSSFPATFLNTCM